MTVCAGPNCPLGKGATIPAEARRIDATVTVNWGAKDLRADWSGSYAFCTFRCVADYALSLAHAHDGHTLVEGNDEAKGLVVQPVRSR